MTDTFHGTKNYRTETFDKEHIHVGGKIYQSDFNTDYRGKDNTNGSTIASRIVTDFQWEKKMLGNAERNKQYSK